MGGEEGVEGVEVFVGEAGADVADGFVCLFGGVVAGEEVGAVFRGAFALAVVGAYYDEIEGVADAREVVFFDFEPVAGALGGLVAGFFAVEHLDHQAFAGGLDRFVQEGLDGLDLARIFEFGELELAGDFGEAGVEIAAAFF